MSGIHSLLVEVFRGIVDKVEQSLPDVAGVLHLVSRGPCLKVHNGHPRVHRPKVLHAHALTVRNWLG